MRLSCIERPSSISGKHSHLCTEKWFFDQKDQKRDPEAIFNVLDYILKSSLDRLASLRFVFSPVASGSYICKLLLMKAYNLLLL